MSKIIDHLGSSHCVVALAQVSCCHLLAHLARRPLILLLTTLMGDLARDLRGAEILLDVSPEGQGGGWKHHL